MSVTDQAKRGIVNGFRRLPPTVTRSLPGASVRSRVLRFHAEVLRVHPIPFARADTLYGFALAGTTADLLQRNVYLFGVWEPDISRWVRGHLKPGDVVVDIGANVGYFSLLAATCVGPTGRVIAFEPVPSIVAMLQANLALNGVGSVTVEPVVAADQDGTAEIFRGDPGNLGLSATQAGEGKVSEGTIRQVRAADAVPVQDRARVRLVKVDTEGDDLRALKGLEPVLQAMTTGAVAVVEVTPEDLAARGQSPQELVDFMRGAGFDRMLAIANSYDGADYARGTSLQPPRPLEQAPTEKTDVIFLKQG